MFCGNNLLDYVDTYPGALDVSNLPIVKYKSQIIDIVRNNQVTIIYGDTGSGKTTQIPQYLLAAGINNDDVIAITQPRRIAAIAMAKRVAQEMNCCLGKQVGYEVRFERNYGASTKIKFMTDGMMLSHCFTDRKLSDYSVIMIDEAHERSIHTDVLLGLLKRIMVKRKDLKVLITSATMKTEKFSTYFNYAPIITFEGRLFPIELIYKDSLLYVDDSVEMVRKIHAGYEKGDILVFLTGEEEIEICCDSLKDIDNLIVLPLFGSIDGDGQRKVFDKVEKGQRKVVVATNIAETCITIDGVKFVIDCGYVKQKTFNPSLCMDVLMKKMISKSQADQRKGRAGRTCSGKCYRLYKEFYYDTMEDDAVPEIYRVNLYEIYLRIVALGLDPMTFEFIDVPKTDRLEMAKHELMELELLTPDGSLTEMGKNANELPVEPILGKVLLSSVEFGCTKDIVTIISMMTERSVFRRDRNCEIYRSFNDHHGDHFSNLNVYNEFVKNGKSKSWCSKHSLYYDTLIKIDQIRDQLIAIMHRKGISMDSLASGSKKDAIRKAIIKGYYRNICTIICKGKYIRCLDREILYVFPGSCLFEGNPDLILYHEVVETSKRFMHGIMKLDASILRDFPNQLKKIRYKLN